MPTYSYQCSHCKESIEAFQKISDPPLILCPKCKKKGLKRGFGGGSALFRFKGDGFYVTDYKKKSSKTECSPSSCPCDKK